MDDVGAGLAGQVDILAQPHPARRAIAGHVDMAIEDRRLIGELVRIVGVRLEAVEEDRLRVTADLGVGENAEDGAVGQLRVAEAVVIQPQPRRPVAFGRRDRGARFMRAAGPRCRD